MELSIEGKFIAIDYEEEDLAPGYQALGMYEIEKIIGDNAVSEMPVGVEPFEIKYTGQFKIKKGEDIDFTKQSVCKIERETGWLCWSDIEDWDPSKLVFEKSNFITPEGTIEVFLATYEGEYEEEMVPDEQISCKTYKNN